MSNQYVDFSAHYNTAYLYAKWTHPGNTAVDPAPPAGRIGPKLDISFTGISISLKHKSKWTIGVARYLNTGFSFGDIYTGGHVGTLLVRLRQEGDGTITAYAGGGLNPTDVMFNTAPFSIHGNDWYYIEFQYEITSGTNMGISASLRIDGTERGSGSGVTNLNVNQLLLQTATVNAHGFSGDATSKTWIGDSYFNDGDVVNAGNPNDSFVGDLTGLLIVPNGDISSAWSGTGSPQYQQINENPPDGDSSYIYSNNPGDAADFDFQDIPGTGVIVTAHRCTLARKDDEGSRSFQHKVNGNLSGEEYFVNDNYVYYRESMEVDPSGAQWTPTSINAANFGVQIIS